MDKKIKVAWICSVSNPDLRENLDLRLPLWRKFFKLFNIGNIDEVIADNSQWNTNAIVEFNKIEDVNLHVVFVHSNLRKTKQHFIKNRINFYAISSGDTSFRKTLLSHLQKKDNYIATWRMIVSTINEINPDIVHIMGAENPSYSLSALLIPKDKPVLVQMQTILNDPNSVIPYSESQKKCEWAVINRANYIGTDIKPFASVIRSNIKRDALIVSTRLMVGEKVDVSQCEKCYDFVYFANRITKSIDLAIEAFAIAHKNHPEITLLVIGGATDSELAALKVRMDELDCKSSVIIKGELPTHNDVMEHIRKARYALLPLKIDFVSGTIRESMCNGLPVITTITSGTPLLNNKRQSVLLSPIGDHEALANNMCALVENNDLAEQLRNNAFVTVDEMFGDDSAKAREWITAYRACINHFHYGTPIPVDIQNIV